MRPCLICVDLQHDYLADRRLEPAAGSIVAGASGWLRWFRARELPIVHVRTTVEAEGGPALPHWDGAGERRCVRGTEGWRFAPEAAPRRGEAIVDKTHYSGFQSGRLRPLLGELEADEVAVVGVHVHGCVRSTALDASAAGLRVSIGADASGSNDPPHAAATRRWMSERGFGFVELEEWEATRPEPASRDAGGGRAGRGRTGARSGEGAAAAARAFAGWSALGAERRVAALEPLPSLLRAEAERLGEAMAAGINKPIGEAVAEVARAADLAAEGLRLASAGGATLRTPEGIAHRIPHGPALLVTPWNNPVAIPVGKIVPCLALGNTAVWKPSPQASSVSGALREVLERLELPPGVLEHVEGGASEVAALVRGGMIRAVSLSGSLAAGRAVHDLCAAELIPLQAELGGNNAAVVCADADIDAAARELASGAFGFAGQRCTATRRVVVEREAHEPLAEGLMARIEELRAGDPRSRETTFGPVISRAAAARIEGLVERAQAEGTEVRRPRWAGEPAFRRLCERLPFVAPAVAIDPAPDSEIVAHESFGPVLVLMGAETLAEAIDLCNAAPQRLAASIFTRSPDAVAEFTRRVRAGILKVNRSTAGAGATLPFGGFGLSGTGPPEHGEGNAEFHTRWQAVYGDGAGIDDAVGAGSSPAESLG